MSYVFQNNMFSAHYNRLFNAEQFPESQWDILYSITVVHLTRPWRQFYH